MTSRPRVTVIGSLNVDYTFRVASLPIAGETLTASGTFTCFGGKGANQAVTAARAGGHVTMIGAIGLDDPGTRYLEHLRKEGIETEAIVRTAAPTGSAFITVDDKGENTIIVDPGANHRLEPEHLNERVHLLTTASLVLLQLECPWPTVKRAIELAVSADVPVMLNPSPFIPQAREVARFVHSIIVNESEAAALTGLPKAELDASPPETLHRSGANRLIITRGSRSTLAMLPDQVIAAAPPRVTPLDTVGAGDAFAGAFAVAAARGLDLADCIRFANAAGALATQSPGAQPPLSEAAIWALANCK